MLSKEKPNFFWVFIGLDTIYKLKGVFFLEIFLCLYFLLEEKSSFHVLKAGNLPYISALTTFIESHLLKNYGHKSEIYVFVSILRLFKPRKYMQLIKTFRTLFEFRRILMP